MISIFVCWCILAMQVSSGADLAKDEKRVEAKDSMKVGEECVMSGDIDSEQLNANPDVKKEAKELAFLGKLFKEFNEARLEKNAAKSGQLMESFFKGLDEWVERAKTATRKEHKEALKKAFTHYRKSCEDALIAEGVTDFEIKDGDSNSKKFLKTALRFADSKKLMLDAGTDAEHEVAYQLAFETKKELQNHMRNMARDEL